MTVTPARAIVSRRSPDAIPEALGKASADAGDAARAAIPATKA
jgi:hypothetical protein